MQPAYRAFGRKPTADLPICFIYAFTTFHWPLFELMVRSSAFELPFYQRVLNNKNNIVDKTGSDTNYASVVLLFDDNNNDDNHIIP